jgi:hypothetical protein
MIVFIAKNTSISQKDGIPNIVQKNVEIFISKGWIGMKRIEELEILIDQNNEKMADLIKQVEEIRIQNQKFRNEIKKIEGENQHG